MAVRENHGPRGDALAEVIDVRLRDMGQEVGW
jgi:hypothetical protein